MICIYSSSLILASFFHIWRHTVISQSLEFGHMGATSSLELLGTKMEAIYLCYHICFIYTLEIKYFLSRCRKSVVLFFSRVSRSPHSADFSVSLPMPVRKLTRAIYTSSYEISIRSLLVYGREQLSSKIQAAE